MAEKRDKNKILKFLGKTAKGLVSPIIPISDMVQNNLKTKAGEFISNVKSPVGYDLPSGENVLKAGKNALMGIDIPVYDGGPDGKIQANIPPRDFLLRSEFGMKDANRMGGGENFIKTGENTFDINSAGPYGKQMQKEIDNAGAIWIDELLNKDNVVNVDEKGNSINVPKKSSVLGNIGFELGGEGQDEKGYYNVVKGTDVWDFGLHDNEPLLNLSQGSFKKNATKTGSNIARTILDRIIDPQKVNYSTKVYIPGIKKKPRKIKAPGNDGGMNADIF